MTTLPPFEAGAWHEGGGRGAARLLERAGLAPRVPDTVGAVALAGDLSDSGERSRLVATRAALCAERAAFGARPLYVGRAAGAWVVASRADVVLAALGLRAAPDLDRLASLAVWVPPADARATEWRGVRTLPPGARYAFGDAAAPRRLAGWSPPAPESIERPVERVVALVRASVGRCIAGARRVGVLTSGGLDSSTVLAACAAERRARGLEPPWAVHLGFDGPGADGPHFEALVRALGVPALRVSPASAGGATSALCLAGGPYPLASGAVELALVEAARSADLDVLLTGAGGDELFGGEPRALAADGLRGLALAVGLDVPGGPSLGGRLFGWGVAPRLAGLVPRGLREARAERRDARDFPWAGPRVLAALERARARDAFATRHVPESPRARLVRLVLDARWDEHLELRTRLEAATGLRREDPLLDLDLAAALAALRPRDLARDGLHRGLLRAVARALGVPAGVALRRDKAHFEPAFAAAFAAGGGADALGELAELRRVEAAGLAEAEGLRRTLASLSAASASGDAWSACWQVLAAEAFLAHAERMAAGTAAGTAQARARPARGRALA